jgi:hypothetical protein
MPNNCGYCFFAEDCGSSDMLFCIVKQTHLKINEYPCARFREKINFNQGGDEVWVQKH